MRRPPKNADFNLVEYLCNTPEKGAMADFCT